MKLSTLILLVCIGLTTVIHGCKEDDVEDCVDVQILSEHYRSQVEILRNTNNFSFERTTNGIKDTIHFSQSGVSIDSIFLFPSSIDKPCSKGGSTIRALERERFIFTSLNSDDEMDLQLVRTEGPTLMFLVFKGYILYHGVGCFLCPEAKKDYSFQSNIVPIHQLEDGLRNRNTINVESCFNEKTGLLELHSNVPSGSASAYYSKDYGIVDFQVNINTDSAEHWVRL